jgi:hypothetical protein
MASETLRGDPVRRLPFLEWHDPLAPLEKQDSPEFAALCKKENEWHSQLIAKSPIQNFLTAQTTKSYLSEHKRHSYIPGAFRAANGRYLFDVNTYSDGSLRLHLPGLKTPLDCESFDYVERADGDYIALTIDESDGQELYTLYIYFLNKKSLQLLWKETACGPSCAIVGRAVFFTRGDKYHIFDTLMKSSLKEKSEPQILLKIKPTENQLLVKRDGHAFLEVTDYATTHLYRLTEDSPPSSVKPASKDQIIGGADIIYYNSQAKRYQSTNHLHVLPLERPIFYSSALDIVLTIKDGIQSLWRLGGKEAVLALTTEVPGQIQIDRIACQGNPHIFAAILRRVDLPPQLVTISKTQVKIQRPLMIHPKLNTTVINAISPDRVRAKGVIVTHPDHPQPTNLLVYCYGAYGHPTRFWSSWNAYGPLLATGRWAICYAMARGGGDDSLEHRHAGRKYDRTKTVDDFEAVIKAAQILLGVGPKQTALYGRSAGGIPVGMMISRYPTGQLFGSAWMEAPFVDILRTMTDHSIPLTLNETEEFGDPSGGPKEFAAVAENSPMDTLRDSGVTAGLNVLLRTGDNDRQVYAYEPLKYAQRLRGIHTMEGALKNSGPAGVYLFCGKGEGHFYGEKTHLRARMEDMATLDFWASSK